MSISLELLTRICVFAFVLTTMFSMGLSLRLVQILNSLRTVRLVALSLAANFVLVPFWTYLITKVVPVNHSLTIALLLLGTCSGAPMLPKLVEFARGNLAQSVGLMVLLMAGTIVYVPIVLPLLVPGIQAHSGSIAKLLFSTMLPPLAGGLVLRAYRKDFATQLQSVMRGASNVALALVIIVVLVDKSSSVASTHSLRIIVAGALLLTVSFGFGFALGGPSADSRKVVALGTSARNMSAAFLVAVENFRQSEVLTMLTVLALLSLLLQIPTAIAWGRLVPRQNANRILD